MLTTFSDPGVIIKNLYHHFILNINKNFKTHIFFLTFFVLTSKTFSNDLRPANCQPDGGQFTVNSSISISFDVCFDFDFPVFANEWNISIDVLDANNINVFSGVIPGVDGNGPGNCIPFNVSTPFVPTDIGTYTLKIHVSYGPDINKSNDICTTTFTVVPRPGIIKGKKFNDKNGNGSFDFSEPGLPGWTITISGGLSAVTDAEGNYSFTTEPGSYVVREVQQTNWTQTFPQSGTHILTLSENQTIENVNFGNRSDSTVISGKKFKDVNGNATFDSNESGLPNWIITLSNNESTILDSAITDPAGNYSFTVLPGSYVVKEVQQDGWDQTFPGGFGEYNLIVTGGNGLSGIDFGNRPQSVIIKGKKFRDENGNGSFDFSESGLPGWIITLSNSELIILESAITDSDGNYAFFVQPASYVISEVQQAGWSQTFPQSGTYTINPTGGQDIDNMNFGNKPLQPSSVSSVSPEDGETGVSASPPPTLTWQISGIGDAASLFKINIPVTSTTVTLEPVQPASGAVYTETFDKDTTSYTPPGDLEYGTMYQWTVTQTNEYGTTENGPFTFTTTATVSINDNNELPDKFKLYQNYPNPFNPSTYINYDVASSVNVNLEVYNMLGQKVAVLVNKMQTQGHYSVLFSADEIPSGIYIYTIRLGNYFSSKKMILLK